MMKRISFIFLIYFSMSSVIGFADEIWVKTLNNLPYTPTVNCSI